MLRRLVPVLAFLMLLGASRARAEAINLSWNNCAIGANAAEDMTFSCDDESKVMVLVGSFITPGGIGQFIGLEGSIQVITDSDVPDFWQLGAEGCRSTSGTPAFSFPGLSGCATPWNSQTLGFWNYNNHDATLPPGRGHMLVDAVRPSNQPLQLSAGREYYAFQMKITMDNSSACQGCREPACFVLNYIALYQPIEVTEQPAVITNPASRNYVTWQGGGSGCTAGGAKTTKKMTWGQIKGRYR